MLLQIYKSVKCGTLWAVFLILIKNTELADVNVVTGPDVIYSEGGTAVLQCSYTTGSGTPILEWLKETESGRQSVIQESGGVVVPQTGYNRHDIGDDANLVINDSIISDIGIYWCKVLNPPDTPGESSVRLFEGIVPQEVNITSGGGNKTFNKDDEVRLTCSADGDPPPTLHWSLDNGQTLTITEDGSIATFNIYETVIATCNATNDIGSKAGIITLFVDSDNSDGFCCFCIWWCILLVILGILLILGGGAAIGYKGYDSYKSKKVGSENKVNKDGKKESDIDMPESIGNQEP